MLPYMNCRGSWFNRTYGHKSLSSTESVFFSVAVVNGGKVAPWGLHTPYRYASNAVQPNKLVLLKTRPVRQVCTSCRHQSCHADQCSCQKALGRSECFLAGFAGSDVGSIPCLFGSCYVAVPHRPDSLPFTNCSLHSRRIHCRQHMTTIISKQK